jgi:hypothetical protein
MSKDAKQLNKDQAVVIDQTSHTADKKVMAAGMKLGKAFLSASTTQRVETLKAAAFMVNTTEDDLQDFLKGFRESFGGSSAVVQSSKVKAVILAYRVPEFKRVSGIDKVTKEVTYKTMTGKDWLAQHVGTFENLVTLAREIRGPQTGQGNRNDGTTKAGKITGNQMESIEGKLAVATTAQATEILARAADQLVAANPKAFEPFIIEQIGFLVKRLATSTDLVFQKLAEDFSHLLNDHSAMRTNMSKEVQAAKNVTESVTSEPIGPAAPIPATEANFGQPYAFVNEPQRKAA